MKRRLKKSGIKNQKEQAGKEEEACMESEGVETAKRKEKGRFPAGEMEKLPLHWPGARSGSLAALKALQCLWCQAQHGLLT